MRITVFLSIMVLMFGCGMDENDLEELKDSWKGGDKCKGEDYYDNPECREQEEGEELEETDLDCGSECAQKEKEKVAEVLFMEHIKVASPIHESETGVNSLLSITYSEYDDKFYLLKQEVEDDLGEKYYPIESAYCSLDNFVREGHLTLESPDKQFESLFKVESTLTLLGMFQGVGTGLWALEGKSDLLVGERLTGPPSTGLYPGVHFMFYDKDELYYMKIPEDNTPKSTVCEVDFYSKPALQDCKMNSNNPIITEPIAGTYFNGFLYVLDIAEEGAELKEYQIDSTYIKAYKISSFKKSSKELRKSLLVADLESLYFVTMQNNYITFDRLLLSQKAKEE